MTTPNQPRDAEVMVTQVTQADRDAASYLLTEGINFVSGLTGAHIRAGRYDDDEMVQSFARHRLSSLTTAEGSGVPRDVARLVVAARRVALGHIGDSVLGDPESRALIKELDLASEAFADRVAWGEGKQ